MNLILNNKRKTHSSMNDKIEFFRIINNIICNESVQKMRYYRQHCNTSCYEHCIRVAYYSYWIAKKLNLDYISIARAAMLHDLFLYDWRDSNRINYIKGMHAFTHPKIALNNALEIFDLNEKEQDIILKHMWPVTISLPRYAESYIVTFTDKYSAIKESFLYFSSELKKKKIYRYAYVFLSLIVFRII